MKNSQHQFSAIVTGGGSGIGFSIAKKFVSEGKQTIIIGRNADKLQQAAESLGEKCIPIQADLNDLGAIPALIKNIHQQYGVVDVLVNNAGINLKKPLTEVSDQDFQSIIHTNLLAVFSMSREIVTHMLANNIAGSIINISSMASLYGLPKVIAYTASKAALDGMTRAMASELSEHNIRINSIAPGFIETDMSAKALGDDTDRMQRVMARTPMKKLGQPEDVANMAWFLASAASSFITGTTIPVDGGNSIGF